MSKRSEHVYHQKCPNLRNSIELPECNTRVANSRNIKGNLRIDGGNHNNGRISVNSVSGNCVNDIFSVYHNDSNCNSNGIVSKISIKQNYVSIQGWNGENNDNGNMYYFL